MTDQSHIEAAIADATNEPFHLAHSQPIGGGCISQAQRISDSKRSFFLKTNALAFRENFAAEALGLEELGDSGTIRVPEVVAQTESATQSYLILEYIESKPPQQASWTKLGQQLADLHAIEQARFGWTRDNFIGASPQGNPVSENWIDFFRTARLEPMLQLCRKRGFALRSEAKLLDALPELLEGHTPKPSLLHGDLWSGNVAFDADGQPFLFDPACYWGDREADLAFTEFFGGFPPDFYAAYQAEASLASGYHRRKTLYNLYHCLNHVCLFGGSYAAQAQTMADQLLHL